MTKELLDYFNQDELTASTWKKKYAEEGEETPDDMHRRLAKEFARIERKYISDNEIGKKLQNHDNLSKYGRSREELDEVSIYNLFKDFKYLIPQGSIMSQLGARSIGSLSNCFVIGQPHDSYGGIMQKDEEQVQLMKRRGGVGLDLSTLRPADTLTSNAAKTSTGAVSFAPRASHSTREVAQNGRRGALMLSMDIKHPDSLNFATMKEDLTQITGANISVKLWDDFMQAVEKDEDYMLRFPVDWNFDMINLDEFQYNELYSMDGEKGHYIKRVKAREYWNTIVKTARDVAEPGLMFWDTMVNYSPDGVYPQFIQVTTNPCSEIAMQPYDACRLLISNLFSFVVNPFTKDAYFDFEKYKEVNYEAMRLMDDVVTLEIEYINRILNKIENDPEPYEVKRTEIELWNKVKSATESSRRTGLGYTGLGDALAALGLKYDSDESIEMIDQIMKAKLKSEWSCSIDLAILRGTFIGWDASKEFITEISPKGDTIKGANPFYQMLLDEIPEEVERMVQYGRRNLSPSCLAPTGTTSLMAQTTSGVEPAFKIFYMRRRKVNPNDKNVNVTFVDENGDSWEEFPVLHHKFKDWLKANPDYLYNIDDENPNITIEELNKEQLEYLVEMSPYHQATANDIDWIKRVEIQGVIQKYTSHSISSTINLPEDVSVEEVGNIYMEAWKRGCKGVTVYRDGSRSGVLVSNDKKETEITTFHENHAPTRPKYLNARLVRFNNNKEKWIAFVGFLDNKPYEIFTGSLENIKIPLKVEHGQIVKVKLEDGTKRYDFIHGEGTVEAINNVFNDDYWNYAKMISSTLRHGMPLHFAVDMVKGLTFQEDHINTWKNGVARALKKFVPDGEAKGMKCNDCESTQVIFEEGCSRCLDCGSSKCS